MSLENQEKALALSEKGYSQRRFAAKIGCSQKPIREILKKHRITDSIKDRNIPRRNWNPVDRHYHTIIRKSKMEQRQLRRWKPRCSSSMASVCPHPLTKEGCGGWTFWSQTKKKAKINYSSQEGLFTVSTTIHRLDCWTVVKSNFQWRIKAPPPQEGRKGVC